MSLKEMEILAIGSEEYEIADKKSRENISNINTQLSNMYVNNVVEMKSLETLKTGDIIKTLGYFSANDGGGANYFIREKQETDIENNGSIHFISDTLVAELIVEKNINVKQFGAKGDGIEEDSTAFQNAINYIKSFATNRNYSKKNVLEIPEGDYKISNTINLSQFVRIKTTGYATIHSYVTTKLFVLEPEAYEGERPTHERYNYWFGEYINGETGFRIVNEMERGETVAFSFGVEYPSDVKTYNMSKTSLKYICINNFNVGIKINPYNYYLTDYHNIYMEQNNYCILVGNQDETDYVDSGENISWNNCIFAGSNIVCQYNTEKQSIDFNFNECSFDFNNCLFYSPKNDESSSAQRKINIINSHIEETSYQVNEVSTPHGILYGAFRGYQITISNSRILITNKYNLFYSNVATSYVLNLISNIITCFGNDENEFKDPAYLFLANDNIKNINMIKNSCSLNTGILTKLSSITNCVIRPDWRHLETGSQFEIVSSSAEGTVIGDFKQGYWNEVSTPIVVSDDSPLSGGKSLKLIVNSSNTWDKGTGNQGPSFALSTKKIPCNPAEIYGVTSIIKNLKNAKTISYVTNFYDENDVNLGKVSLTGIYTPSTEWKASPMPRFFKVPSNAKYFITTTTFVQANNDTAVDGEEFLIGGIFIERV